MFFDFTLLIPLAGIGLGYVAVRNAHERKMARIAADSGNGNVGMILAKIERIEQRLAVVERLATDPAARLADDIERLRDARS